MGMFSRREDEEGFPVGQHEAAKKFRALALKIDGQIGAGGLTTDVVSISLTKEEAALVCAALASVVEGL